MTNTSLHMSHKHLHICQTLADVRCFSASRKARLCNTFYNGHQAVIGAPGGRKLIVSRMVRFTTRRARPWIGPDRRVRTPARLPGPVNVLAEDPHGAGGARGRRLKSVFPLAGLVATTAAVRPVRSALACQSRAAAAWS
jgi:hypothetical protein